MFRKRMQDAYDTLSPRFLRLANYILENTLDVGFLTATELASKVSVDPATVVRFAQELGYTGYRELSREIKKYVNEQLVLRNQRGVIQELEGEENISPIIDDMSDRVLDMKTDATLLTEVAHIMHKAPQIHITGTPEGYNLGLVWSLYLKLIGLPIQCIEGHALQAALLLSEIKENDVIIFITLGLSAGTSLSHVIHTAREKGARTICISPSPTLLLAREADVNLAVNTRTPSGYPSFDAITSLLSTLWQILINYDQRRAENCVKQSFAYVDRQSKASDKESQQDSTSLMRLWGLNR